LKVVMTSRKRRVPPLMGFECTHIMRKYGWYRGVTLRPILDEAFLFSGFIYVCRCLVAVKMQYAKPMVWLILTGLLLVLT
jgi:hypothetical protein